MKTTSDLSFLKVVHKSDDLYTEFYRMAKILFEQFAVTDKNGKRYILIDIEFYLLSMWHQDFFTYGSVEQKNFGEWLKHSSGMDLTFGGINDNAYAGILIRGIREVDDDKNFINGSLNVRDTLSKTNHTVTSEDLNNSVGLIKHTKTENNLILISGRVGLTINSLYEHHKRLVTTDSGFGNIISSNHELFINRKYRFITDICPKNKFREKERVAVLSVNAGICTAKWVNEKYEWKVFKQ